MGYLLTKVYGDKVWTGSEDDEALIKFIKDPWERGVVHPPSLSPPEFPHPYLTKDNTTHTMCIYIYIYIYVYIYMYIYIYTHTHTHTHTHIHINATHTMDPGGVHSRARALARTHTSGGGVCVGGRISQTPRKASPRRQHTLKSKRYSAW